MTVSVLSTTKNVLWSLPPRRAAALLQAVGVVAWCEEGRVVDVVFSPLVDI